jgi:hypothetical protein
VDSATPLMQVTVEATAGAAVFGEGSGPAWDGAEAMEEASGGEPFIRTGEQGTPRLLVRRTAHGTAIPTV